MAMASVRCASGPRAPRDIAWVLKRRTISDGRLDLVKRERLRAVKSRRSRTATGSRVSASSGDRRDSFPRSGSRMYLCMRRINSGDAAWRSPAWRKR